MTAPRITAEELTHMRRDVVDELDALRGGDGLSRKFARIAQRLLAELDRLSAQGGEVPEIQQPKDVDWIQLKRDAEAYGLDWGEGFYQGLAYSNKWLRANLRPAPPHPDTVEVSREELEILRDAFGLLRTAWNTRALYDYQTVLAEAIIRKHDAIRAQAQPTTNETRG